MDLDRNGFREFAFAAADLLVSTDAYGCISTAVGDATLLHHPTPDRLAGRNALDLISESGVPRLREALWSLAPGRRLAWDDPGSLEGGRRIVVQRSLSAPETFNFTLSRMPVTMIVRGDRSEDLLADRFRDAVSNGRLKAARQPVVDVRSGLISHYEVLARFDGEDSSPLCLIGAAEKSGQISHLDYVMVRAAVARLAAAPDPALRFAVNISGQSIQRLDVTQELCALVVGHDFLRSRLIIEVTESSCIQDLDAASHCVDMLRATGISVALDDFGAGAASFGYLRALNIDSLKFDGGFLSHARSNDRNAALMRNIARMCAELGISSVGERVETEADRRVLIDAGIRLAQGYLFGRPAIDETFFSRSGAPLRTAA